MFVQMRLSAGPPAEVLKDLKAVVPQLQDEARDEVERWIEELRSTPDVTDSDPLAQLSSWLGESPPDLRGLELAGTLAAANRWSDLAPFLDRIDRFRTPTSVSLVAYVMHHTAQPADLLAFIDDNTDAYPHGKLPLDMRRLRLATLSDLEHVAADAEARRRGQPAVNGLVANTIMEVLEEKTTRLTVKLADGLI